MIAPSTFSVGLVQMAVTGDSASTLAAATEKIREAAGRGAQVISLQELFNAPYFCKSLKLENFDIAESIPGPTVGALQRVAQELGVVLVVPIYERQAPGIYKNSAAVLPHDPLFEEKYYFTPGDVGPDLRADQHPGINGFRVWNTKYARIGVLICWDQWYPEAARITSLLGAEVLFYPTAIGWHPAEKATFGTTQVDAWRTAQRAHAIANGVFVAAANRVGFEAEPGTDGLEFFGHSFICDPIGRYLAEAQTDPAVLVATCDRALIEDTRRNWPFLRDRRIDAYGPITNRWLGGS
jgi:N-carbamoylputrescine amidase